MMMPPGAGMRAASQRGPTMSPVIRALLWASALAPSALPAASPPNPGCAAESRQFDFWIGRWNVTMGGKPAGTSHIERILEGCALLENWSGAQGGDGKSLNFYSREDGKWHQTWISSNGGALFLSGGIVDGAMRLEGQRPASQGNPATRERIIWTPLSGGKVRQLWESAPAGTDAWRVQFDGIYEPAK
jgi:hypothetical protein